MKRELEVSLRVRWKGVKSTEGGFLGYGPGFRVGLGLATLSRATRLWQRNSVLVCTEVDRARRSVELIVIAADWKGLLNEVDGLPCKLTFIDERSECFVVMASPRTYELIQLW